MALTNQQLEAILARALPGDRLTDARALPDGRYALALTGGERLNVQAFDTPQAAAAATAALRLLRAEVDLPIPQLRASDAEGSTVGVPYVLTSEVSGEPLAQALPRLGDEQLYGLGRRLGEIVCRVHRLACERYGSLMGDSIVSSDERGYVLARLEGDLQRCRELGLLDRRISADLTAWFERAFKPLSRQPALVYGNMSPQTILVRQSGANWSVSGLLGWDRALGWCPAWDHVCFLDTTDEQRCFGLRVGYGNGYDDSTTRPYEQVREHAMAPYRLLLHLQRMQEAQADGRLEECEQRRGMLRALMRFLDT